MTFDRRKILTGSMALGSALLIPGVASAAADDGSPLVSNAFDSFRRLYSASDDQPRCWWYDLETFATARDWPTLHLLSMRALFACRSRLVGKDEMLIDYLDIGVFLDPTTGQPLPADWVNPITRKPGRPPLRLSDGKGSYCIRRRGDGVDMMTRGGAAEVAVQARYREGGVSAELAYERVSQTVAGPSSYRQSIIGSRDVLRNSSAVSDQGQGAVEGRSPLLPVWAGFSDLQGETLVQGSMRKSALNEVVNPETVRLLQPLYPQWFVKGAYTPIWG